MESFKIEDLQATNGKVITCKAAVAWEAKKPLDYTDVQVDVPHKVRTDALKRVSGPPSSASPEKGL